MRRRAFLLAFLVVAASILATVQANAAGTVYVYKVYFDSPGKDSGSNTSLNAEYVVIRNGDNVSHSVSGWTVRDKAGHIYKFGNLRLELASRPSFRQAKAPATPPPPVRTCIGVGNGMCGTTLATR